MKWYVIRGANAGAKFFKWVSDTIEQGNKSMGTNGTVSLPPPPKDINVVT